MTSVFANGIWKSGNNLLLKLCAELGIPFSNFGIATSSLLGGAYLLRQIIRGDGCFSNGIQIGLDVTTTVSEKWLDKKFNKLQNTCIGGHAAYSDYLLDILKSNGYKPIQIIRDPRDVVVSFAHWIIKRPDYYAYTDFINLDLEARMIKIITGYRGEKNYFESLATILDRSYGWITRSSDVLVVRFEKLVGEKGGGDADSQQEEIRRILEWTGVKVNNLNKLSEELFGDTQTFRKGRIGSWKEEFTENVKEVFQDNIGDRLSQWGYK